MQILTPNVFPSIRLSLFCGEPFPIRSASAWQQAVPKSRIINLYGPTEATCAISGYEWHSATSPSESEHGVVPLGHIFPSQKACLLNNAGQVVLGPGQGELCLAGSQVTRGYLNNPEKTAKHYIRIPECSDDLWYRTGDIIRRNTEGCLFFMGRADHQIKIHGHRVELQEIDTILRQAAQSDLAVAIPWPRDTDGIKGIVACIAGNSSLDTEEILKVCCRYLPSYMIPSKVVVMPELPLNSNGKIDREALFIHLNNLSGTS